MARLPLSEGKSDRMAAARVAARCCRNISSLLRHYGQRRHAPHCAASRAVPRAASQPRHAEAPGLRHYAKARYAIMRPHGSRRVSSLTTLYRYFTRSAVAIARRSRRHAYRVGHRCHCRYFPQCAPRYRHNTDSHACRRHEQQGQSFTVVLRHWHDTIAFSGTSEYR